MIDEAVAQPERMHLVDLTTGEDVTVFFNPEQLAEQVSVNYSRLTIPGLSHQVLQYVNTNNHGVTLSLYAAGHTTTEVQLVDDYRRFLLSLCLPPGRRAGIRGGAPPRVLFVWPLMFTMQCVISDVRIEHSRFTQRLASSRFIASVTLEEIRDARLTSEDVRRQGTRRSPSGAGQES